MENYTLTIHITLKRFIKINTYINYSLKWKDNKLTLDKSMLYLLQELNFLKSH